MDTEVGGIVADGMIEAMVARGHVLSGEALFPGQIQPASLDLRLGSVAYRVRASFLPGPGATVAEGLERLRQHHLDIGGGAVLEPGCVYLVPLQESLALPPKMSASANPKSSTGRLDIFTRVIADGARRFDTVPEGYVGPLYAEISPKTFPVKVRRGSRLSQIRFRIGAPLLTPDELAELHRATPLVDAVDVDLALGVPLGVDLAGEDRGGLVGYRAKRHAGVVDVDLVRAYPAADFWEPIRATSDRTMILDPGEFYILASKESVQVPPTCAAEMVPFDHAVGEFRVHYAGFFDPGFGWVAAGAGGTRAVLEVRSREVPFILEDGQLVGRLAYERMLDVPKSLYGCGERRSNYQKQTLALAKHFIA